MPARFLQSNIFRFGQHALILRCAILTTMMISDKVLSFYPGVLPKLSFISNVILRSSPNDDDYRSISDVVGGLHGGKYQFSDPTGIPSFGGADAFSGFGSSGSCTDDLDDNNKHADLPNWALKMEPMDILDGQPEIISVPSNSNPMDGMTYFASFVIKNQEMTWEPFFVKILVREKDGTFTKVDNDFPVSAKPKSGSLAPRGGSSNACDASQIYSDSAVIKVLQNNRSIGSFTTVDGVDNICEIWIVAGTEEEQWSYQLDLQV